MALLESFEKLLIEHIAAQSFVLKQFRKSFLPARNTARTVPPGLEFDFTAKHRKWDWITFASAVWGIHIWMIISFLLWIFVQVAAMIDIVRDPTVSLGFSLFVVAYVIVATIGAIGLGLRDSPKDPVVEPEDS
jgi:hypothetical protein